MQTFPTWELAQLCWSAALRSAYQKQYAPQVLELAAAYSTAWDAMRIAACSLCNCSCTRCTCGYQIGVRGLVRCADATAAAAVQEGVGAAVGSPCTGFQAPAAGVCCCPTAATWHLAAAASQGAAHSRWCSDIAVATAAGSQVAIEVDGPSHVLRPENTLDSPTRSRNRTLTTQGWRVVSVPYFEWDGLKPGQQQQDYLLQAVFGSVLRQLY